MLITNFDESQNIREESVNKFTLILSTDIFLLKITFLFEAIKTAENIQEL